LPKRAVAVMAVTVSIILLILFFSQDSIFGFLTPAAPPDFGISASPSSLSLLGLAGSSVSTTVTVRSIRGFSSEVSLNVTPSTGFFGITFTFNPDRVTPPADGQAESTLTITVDAGVPSKVYFIDVTGRSDEPSRRHTVRIQVIVE